MTGTDVRAQGLSKSFGPVAAVREVGFTAAAGRVTGFLGPNGAGKTTTVRMMLGLVTPDAGQATFGGQRYTDLRHPTRIVGAAIDSSGLHPSLTALDHLRVHAAFGAYPRQRVDHVIGLLDLGSFATRKIRGFSLGMRQRLLLATALLGDPEVLVLDEPANGLDPIGIRWLRGFLRDFAASGRTVLMASHMLAEVQQGVDDVVLIDRGRVVHTGPVQELVRGGRSLEDAFFDLTTTDGALT